MLSYGARSTSRERTLCRSKRTPCRSRSSPFQTALDNLLTLVEQDDDLSRLLETMPQVLGSGVLLQPLFARLFPEQLHPIAFPLPGHDKPELTPQEVKILQEMAQRRSKKEIAKRLFIAPNTVKTHFQNLYAKLEVDTPQQAVAEAMALGLLLFLVSPLTAQVCHDRSNVCDLKEKAFLFEFTPDGHLVRAFDGEGSLSSPSALAFAPPAAKRHGFTPGNLFVFNHTTHPHPLNTCSITELTPHGRYARAFTGGRHISTRLNQAEALTFTLDGRLLAGSGDAVLEFTEGGKRVRRFAHLVPYGGMTVDRHGNIYVAGGWALESPVHVFDPQGERLGIVGAAERSQVYKGVAVDDRGNLFVANTRDHCIEVFDASGHRLGSIKGSGLHHPQFLALSPSGNLYVIEYDDRQVVKVFNPTRGNLLFSFQAPQGVRLQNLTFGPNGNLFIAGMRDEG